MIFVEYKLTKPNGISLKELPSCHLAIVVAGDGNCINHVVIKDNDDCIFNLNTGFSWAPSFYYRNDCNVRVVPLNSGEKVILTQE